MHSNLLEYGLIYVFEVYFAVIQPASSPHFIRHVLRVHSIVSLDEKTCSARLRIKTSQGTNNSDKCTE